MSGKQRQLPRPTLAEMMREQQVRGLSPQLRTKGLPEIGAQVSAGSLAATDMIAFGKGRELMAAQMATKAMGGLAMAMLKPKEFRELYEIALEQAKLQEAYDIEHRNKARRAGQVVGAVALVAGAPEVAFVRGVGVGARGINAISAGARGARPARGMSPALAGPGRLTTEAAPGLVNKLTGTTALAAGGGAVAGGVGEGFNQGVQGRFDPRDAAAAMAAGAIDGVATKIAGSSIGGAIGGVADSTLRGDTSVDDLYESLARGAFFGRAGRSLGSNATRRLSNEDKGLWGEQLSILKGLAEGKIPRDADGVMHLRPILDGRKTRTPNRAVPDLFYGIDDSTGVRNFTESKLGDWADLTRAQKLAVLDKRNSIQIDHWSPLHLGNSLGALLSAFGTPMLRDNDERVSASASEWSIFNPWAVH